VQEITKHVAEDAASLTKLGFLYLILHSYQAWRERRPMSDGLFDRVEPVFTEVSGNGAPIVAIDAEHENQRRRLFERVNSSMSKITAPIGRAATHVDIWVDNEKLDRLERRFSVTEEEIAAALLPLRAAWQRGHRVI
jgi:hypothetical protein